ncbi:MAG: hypothetical protein JOZ62_07430 [Acidobacteriaceae bacterium]|nr:hypothetical protein [Acidobacteriaceae bacterium]
MSIGVDWPSTLSINAYLGEDKRAAAGPVAERARAWVLRNAPPEVRSFLKAPTAANPADWRDARVGWGLVLPDGPELTDSQRANGSDAPEPIQALLRERKGAPILRYRAGSQHRFRLLRNYVAEMDVSISGSPDGTEPGALPRYLLIYGTPEEVPWELQYILNGRCCVGRLHLFGPALENYVNALLNDWKKSELQTNHSVVWAVDQGDTDITKLMRDAIAEKVQRRLLSDPQIGPSVATFLDGANQATASGLVSALAVQKPGLIVTTSHGQTYPLDNPEMLSGALGLPVDQNFASLQASDLQSQWQPDGGIWYAHACCSAGSDSQTLFTGVVDEGSEVDRVLKGVAKLGAKVAPLPTALLGAKKPLRAFIGHVEPTFDLTLRESSTGQILTAALEKALYDGLYQPWPVGLAFRDAFAKLASLYVSYESNRRAFNGGGNTRGAMLKDLLVSRDVQSMVILGDPTAMLPV